LYLQARLTFDPARTPSHRSTLKSAKKNKRMSFGGMSLKGHGFASDINETKQVVKKKAKTTKTPKATKAKKRPRTSRVKIEPVGRQLRRKKFKVGQYNEKYLANRVWKGSGDKNDPITF
jgi:hypothetical protein